jgi:hypothetical protein
VPDAPLRCVRGWSCSRLHGLHLWRRKFLLKDGELGPILVNPDVCATHTTLAVKGRTTMQHSMVVHHYDQDNVDRGVRDVRD